MKRKGFDSNIVRAVDESKKRLRESEEKVLAFEKDIESKEQKVVNGLEEIKRLQNTIRILEKAVADGKNKEKAFLESQEHIEQLKKEKKDVQNQIEDLNRDIGLLRNQLREETQNERGFPPDYPAELNDLFRDELPVEETEFYLNVAHYMDILSEFKVNVDPLKLLPNLYSNLPQKEKEFLRTVCDSGDVEISTESHPDTKDTQMSVDPEASDKTRMIPSKSSFGKNPTELKINQTNFESPDYCVRKKQALGAAVRFRSEPDQRKTLIRQNIEADLMNRIMTLIKTGRT